jgi:hypothetical protein
MIYIVYCTTNILNKKIYIGVHKCESNKFDGYIGCGVYVNKPSTYNKPKTTFQFAVQKYGPSNFKRIVIKEYDNLEDAYNLEAELVNKEFLQRKDVYNEILGGNVGDTTTAVACHQYDLNGKYLRSFDSQQDAARYVGRGFSTIKHAIKNHVKSADSYWALEKVDTLDLTNYKTTDNRVPVFQYSISGEYDCCYESVADAARVNNEATSNISRSCKLGFRCGDKYFSYEFQPTYSIARNEQIKNQKVYQYSLDGQFIKEYDSYLVAQRELGKHGLGTAIKLGRLFADFQWKLEKFDSIAPVKSIHNKARAVGQYDLDGNLIKTYRTVTDCGKDFPGSLQVLRGKYKTSGGFVFKYIE